MGPGYVRGQGYISPEQSHAVENTDHYDSRGGVTPSYTDTAPDYLPSIDYSTWSSIRAENPAAREITDAIAEVSRQDTDVVFPDNLQDNAQDNQDMQDIAQEAAGYDWFDDYNALLNGSENATDAQDIDPGLESLLAETDVSADMQDDNQDSEADEELEQDVEYLQY